MIRNGVKSVGERGFSLAVLTPGAWRSSIGRWIRRLSLRLDLLEDGVDQFLSGCAVRVEVTQSVDGVDLHLETSATDLFGDGEELVHRDCFHFLTQFGWRHSPAGSLCKGVELVGGLGHDCDEGVAQPVAIPDPVEHGVDVEVVTDVDR